MHKLAFLRFLKLNLEYQNINMGRRTYEHLSFNLHGTGIMQSNTTVVCMVAVSFGGVAIVVAILHRGALRSLLGERLLWWLCFIGVIALMVGWGYAFWYERLWIWGRGLVGRGVFRAGPGFRVGWRTAAGGRGVNCCFAGLFCYWWRSAHFGWGAGRWAIILWSLGSVLIFPNFLRP